MKEEQMLYDVVVVVAVEGNAANRTMRMMAAAAV